MNDHCACHQDVRGNLTVECQEHERIRREYQSMRDLLRDMIGGHGFYYSGHRERAVDILKRIEDEE